MNKKNLIKKLKKYLERRKKAKICVIKLPYCENADLQDIENPGANRELSSFEQEVRLAMAVDPTNTTRLLTLLKAKAEEFPHPEKIVARKILEGYSNKEIADFLGVHERTVRRKQATVLPKLYRYMKEVKKLVQR